MEGIPDNGGCVAPVIKVIDIKSQGVLCEVQKTCLSAPPILSDWQDYEKVLDLI